MSTGSEARTLIDFSAFLSLFLSMRRAYIPCAIRSVVDNLELQLQPRVDQIDLWNTHRHKSYVRTNDLWHEMSVNWRLSHINMNTGGVSIDRETLSGKLMDK